MNYDKISLGRQAKLQRYDRDQFEKVNRLVNVLRLVYTNPLLKDLLALKGGTAINLTVFDVPRLSTDIDMDFTQNLPRGDMLSSRREIHELLIRMMTAEGYQLNTKKSKDIHALDSMVFSYRNAGGVNDNIKIEINYMARCHILPLELKETLIPWQEDNFSILCVNELEMYASKITALVNRGAARDLFDVTNMLEHNLFSAKELDIIKKCALVYMTVGSQDTNELFSLEKVSCISQHKIYTDLLPMLKHGTTFHTENAKQRCLSFLDSFLVLSQNEQDYVEAYLLHREFHPEYLFPDSVIAEALKEHPMALWKCRKEPYIDETITEKKSVKALLAELENEEDQHVQGPKIKELER